MDPACVELFNSLESNKPQVVEEAKKQFHILFNSVKEAWLMHGMFDVYMTTNSVRILEIFVGVREPHEQFLFDKLSECMKCGGLQKVQSLQLLGSIVKRSPTWLYKIVKHSLMKDLLRLLKSESEIIPIMSALLPLIMLLPNIAGLISQQLLFEIFEVFSRLAGWNTVNQCRISSCQLLHLQVGLYSLFNRLYGMYPVNFIHYLRNTYCISQDNPGPVFKQTILPMLECVRMHPLLVTGSKDREVSAARWKEFEPHDVLMECSKMALPSCCTHQCQQQLVPPNTPLVLPSSTISGDDLSCETLSQSSLFSTSEVGLSGNVMHFSKKLATPLEHCDELWSPTVYTSSHSPPTSAPTSIPHTPISHMSTYSGSALVSGASSSIAPHQEGTSPPEAAVEATPESTPVKDGSGASIRQVRDGVASLNSSVPVNLNPTLCDNSNNLGSSNAGWQPASPLRKDTNFFRYPPASPLLSSNLTPVPDLNNYNSVNSNQSIVRTNQYINATLSRLHLERIQMDQVSRQSPQSDVIDQEDREVEVFLRSAAGSSTVGNHPQPNQHYSYAGNLASRRRSSPLTLFAANSVPLKAVGMSVSNDPMKTSKLGGDEWTETSLVSSSAVGNTVVTCSSSVVTSTVSMAKIHRFNRRLRYFSNCLPDTKSIDQFCSGDTSPSGLGCHVLGTSEGAGVGGTGSCSVSSDVRRAVSCPEMKKFILSDSKLAQPSVSVSSKNSLDSSNRQINGLPPIIDVCKELSDSCTQTDEPILYGYEHLFPCLILNESNLPPSLMPTTEQVAVFSPEQAIERYIEQAANSVMKSSSISSSGISSKSASTSSCSSINDPLELKACRDEMALLLLELSLERYRRQMHAERNRRLSGKYRDSRSLEEHNAALKDQLSLLDKENDDLRSRYLAYKVEMTAVNERLRAAHRLISDKCAQLENDNSELKISISLLQEELDKQKELNDNITKEWREKKALIFELENSIRGAAAEAHSGKTAAEKAAALSARLLSAGETETKLLGIIQRMATTSTSAQDHVNEIMATYKHDLQNMKEKCDAKELLLDKLKNEIIELQCELGAKEKELKEISVKTIHSNEETVKQMMDKDARIASLSQIIADREEDIMQLQASLASVDGSDRKSAAISGASGGIGYIHQSSPPLSASVSSSGTTLSLSGGEPTPLKNLQLLVNTMEEVKEKQEISESNAVFHQDQESQLDMPSSSATVPAMTPLQSASGSVSVSNQMPPASPLPPHL